jgi:hypothetical protein
LGRYDEYYRSSSETSSFRQVFLMQADSDLATRVMVPFSVVVAAFAED